MQGSGTIEVTLALDDEWHELLIAELADLDFEAFETDEGVLRAYILVARWSDAARECLERWLYQRGLEPSFAEVVYEPENWNRAWEETIQPTMVGQFVIQPTWSTVRPEHRDQILLEIDPKMSFGTGYHESTRLALRALPHAMVSGARVLDAGTGTGVLAIAAARLGAATVVAFDNDEWSYINATENTLINGVAGVVSVRLGTIEVVTEERFELILANVNRSVLIEMLPTFESKLADNGRIVLSGLLAADREAMMAAAGQHALCALAEDAENEWWAVTLARNNR